MKVRQLLQLLALFTLPLLTAGQNSPIDSLWQAYQEANTDSVRVELLIESIGYELENSNPDSALVVYQRGLELAKKIESISAQARGNMYIAIMHMVTGKTDSAITYFNVSLGHYKSMSESPDPKVLLEGKKGVAALYNNISNIYIRMANYPVALDYLIEALKMYEELDSKNTDDTNYSFKLNGVACRINIGDINIQLENNDLALQYLNAALSSLNELVAMHPEDMVIQVRLVEVNVNLGVAFFQKKDWIIAKEYFLAALSLAEPLGYYSKVSACLTNLGNIEQHLGRFSSSLDFYKRALKLREELNDVYGVALIHSNISKIYILLAQDEKSNETLRNDYLNIAIRHATTSMEKAKELRSFSLENEAAARLMEIYAEKGDYKASLEYSSLYISTRDSMFREEKTKAIAEMQTKYETEKKQQEIEKQQLLIEKQEIDNKRQRNLRNFFIAGTLLLALLALAIFRSYQQKKKSNAIITEKNKLLELANEEIAAQRDLVTEQKVHIETIHEELTSSIRYARRIQGAVLPAPSQMCELLGDHFVLFKPKDIVSGDFFWATKVKHFLVFCVADCTGHGVPGAFMSMLGVSFLNDIVHKENVTTAADILNHLRESVIAALKQKGEGGEQKDGMDMGLCVIDTETKKMQFAGGYNPCWVVPNPEYPSERLIDPRPEEDPAEGVAVIQLKPDKMPIAIHKHMEPYTNHLLQLYPGDQVFLMSDGFQDQFGGPQGKKFMVKNLRELVVANASLPMDQQRIALESALEQWKNGVEQVDDVTILGLKV